MKTECSEDRISLGRLGRREIVANFAGGRLSSDGGAFLLRLAEEKTGLVGDFAAQCMTDHRNPRLIEHTVRDLLAQRVFGLALGYEDLNLPPRVRDRDAATALPDSGVPSEAGANTDDLSPYSPCMSVPQVIVSAK